MRDAKHVRLARLFMLVAATSLAGTVNAAEPGSLRDFLFPHRQEGASLASGRYQPAEGEGFIIDRSNPEHVLLRFDDSAEVWALKPVSGPRGDVIYKNDTGEPVLRATRLGGLTLFTEARPGGAATAYGGDGPLIRLPAIPNANMLFQSLVQSSLRASRAAQHLVVFEAPDLSPRDITPSASSVLADAAAITADAFSRLAGHSPIGRSQVARFAKVQFTTGREAQAQATGTVMIITISPDKGFAGRPSSARIERVMSRK